MTSSSPWENENSSVLKKPKGLNMVKETFHDCHAAPSKIFCFALARVDEKMPAMGGPTGCLIDSMDCTSRSRDGEGILMRPYHYLESRPGKDIRSQLINVFDAWLQVPATSLSVIKRVVGQLHTASLLIDDIQDNSQLRRGAPVAHNIFGVAQTINSANYVYFAALEDLFTLENLTLTQIYTAELLNLHHGQGMDLFWRDEAICPTEDQYFQMVSNKTGGLFRLAVRLMCAESQSKQPTTTYIRLANTVGLLFQILDDYRNLTDDVYTKSKGLYEDITEGKFSFPIIHAMRSDPGSSFLLDILQKHTTDEMTTSSAVSYIKELGSLSYTRQILRQLMKKH